MSKTIYHFIGRQFTEFQTVGIVLAYKYLTLNALHIANGFKKFLNPIHNIYMRVVQVHGYWPVKEHILALYQLNVIQRVQWTEDSKALVDVVIGRERTAGKVKENFLLGPFLRNIKVKLPNSVSQISFYGLVKLERTENCIRNSGCGGSRTSRLTFTLLNNNKQPTQSMQTKKKLASVWVDGSGH